MLDYAWLPNAPVGLLAVVPPLPNTDDCGLGADAWPNADVLLEAPRFVELPKAGWPKVDLVPPVLPNADGLPNVDCCGAGCAACPNGDDR